MPDNSEIKRLQNELNAVRNQLAKQNLTPAQKNNATQKLEFAKVAFEQKQIERKKLKNKLETLPHIPQNNVMKLIADFDRGTPLKNVVENATVTNKKKNDERKALAKAINEIPNNTPKKFEALQMVNKPRVDLNTVKNLITELRSNTKNNAIPVIQQKKIQTATTLSSANIPADIKKELNTQLNAAATPAQVAKIEIKIKNIRALNNRLNNTSLNTSQKKSFLNRVKRGENLVSVQRNVNAAPTKKKKGFFNSIFGEVNAAEKIKKLNVPPEIKRALNAQVTNAKVENTIEAVKNLNAQLNKSTVLNNTEKKAALNRVVRGESVNAVRKSLNLPKPKPTLFGGLFGAKANTKTTATKTIEKLNVPPEIKRALNERVVNATNNTQVQQVQKKIEAVKNLNAQLNKSTVLNNTEKKAALNRVIQGESLNVVKKSLALVNKSLNQQKAGMFGGFFAPAPAPAPAPVPAAAAAPVANNRTGKNVDPKALLRRKIVGLQKLNAKERNSFISSVRSLNNVNNVYARAANLNQKKHQQEINDAEKKAAEAAARAQKEKNNANRRAAEAAERAQKAQNNAERKAALNEQRRAEQEAKRAEMEAKKAEQEAQREQQRLEQQAKRAELNAKREQQRLEQQAKRAELNAKREQQRLEQQAKRAEQQALQKEKQNRYASIMRNANINRAYLNRYLVGKNINALNMNNLRSKAQKDRELAQLIANSKGSGLFGKARPKLVYVNPSNYNRQYQSATLRLKNLQNATKQKNVKTRLMSLGRVNMAYINAYKGDKTYEEINTEAFKNKVAKDTVVAKTIQKAQNKLFPKIVYIKPEQYNAKLADAQKQLANVEEKRKTNAADRNAVKKLLNGARVDMAYLRAYARNKKQEPKNVNVSLLKNKANKDRAVSETLGRAKKGKSRLLYIPPDKYNAELERAQKMLENKKAGNAAAVEKTRLSKEEGMLLQKLSRNANVDVAYVREFAKASKKKYRNIQLANLTAKRNKDKLLAEEMVKGKTSFTGKPVPAVLRYVPNASYARLMNVAKKQSEARLNKQKKYANKTASKVKAENDKRANVNTIASLAKNSGVSTKYVQALLKNRGLKPRNLTKNVLDKKKNANMVVARERVTDKFSVTGKPVEATLAYIRNKNYNAETRKAVQERKRRQAKQKTSANKTASKVKAENDKRANDAHIATLLKTVGGRRYGRGQYKRANVLAVAKRKGVAVREVTVNMLRNYNGETASPESVKARAEFESKLKALKIGMLQRRQYMKRFNDGETANAILKGIEQKGADEKIIQQIMKNHKMSRQWIVNSMSRRKITAQQLLNEFQKQKGKVKNAKNKRFEGARMGAVKEPPMLVAKKKTALVQKIQKSIPGAFGQFRRAWESDVRQAKTTAELAPIEKLLDEKVKLRDEIQKAKITEPQRKGHLRWVMQKRNDASKRRAELAAHVQAFGKEVAVPTKKVEAAKTTTKTGGGLTLNAAKSAIRDVMKTKRVSADSAFKRLSLKYHPNKGGSQANFITLQQARNAVKREPAAAPVAAAKNNPVNRGVRSKLNSKYYDKLTQAERDGFFKRWMEKKNKTIWADARKIQASRSKPKALAAPPSSSTKPKTNVAKKWQAASTRAVGKAKANAKRASNNKSRRNREKKARIAKASQPRVAPKTKKGKAKNRVKAKK